MGEDIELDARLACELLPIRIDFGQLEQMLVNLCANARDAVHVRKLLDKARTQSVATRLSSWQAYPV